LIQEIFTRYLFPSVFHQDQSDKSSSLTVAQVIESRRAKKRTSGAIESKSAAYRLLNSLLRRDRQLMDFFLQECLMPLMSHIERPDGWNYTPPSATERNQEFVGLRNLGCICYMNSMLQ
jgi:ubiquitin C-terminal hydrolase